PWLAVGSAALFAFGHALYLKTIHPQHYAIDFLPVAGLLILTSLLQARSSTGQLLFALTGGLLFSLCFATGYYMPWFFSLFLLFASPLFAFLYRLPLLEFVQQNRNRVVMSLIGGVIGFALGSSLVLWIYLPAVSSLRSMSNGQFLAMGATFRDIINVSDGNLLWGALLRSINVIPFNRLQMTEV